MKKRIMVFMLLFAFLVGVGVPDQAKAANSTEATGDDVKYRDIEDFMHSKGYTSFVKEDGYYYIFVGGDSSTYYYLYKVKGSSDNIYFCTNNQTSVIFLFGDDDTNVSKLKYYSYSKAVENNNYNLQGTEDCSSLDGYYNIKPDNPRTLRFTHNGIAHTYYSDVNIYQCNFNSSTNLLVPGTDVILYESNIDKSYSFEHWCSDAGLTCAASSNETEDLYDFSFNPEENHYIIRRNRISGSEYTWYLSQVTKEEDLIYYATNRALADSSIGAAALYVLSGEFASGSTSVCNYVYDSSGGGWLYTDNYSVDLGLTNDYYVDDIGITYSSSMPIVYSSTDIYSNKEQSSVYYAASTEYEDSKVTYPDISPTSTPTPTPISNSGSTDLGGNVIAGGGIDFIISLVSSLWNRVYSIPMNVDGFQISLQQLYVYGIFAGIVGAAIFAFTRRK